MALGNALSVKLTHTIAHFLGGYYFRDAEKKIAREWADHIEPRLQDVDLSVVLDFAAGYGRNSQYLLPLVGNALHIVDANRVCIEHCRKRFAGKEAGTQIFYHVNNGTDLQDIASESITFLYTWDSMVHFDRSLTSGYLREFARVLAPGGKGLIHHSNYGSAAPSRFWLVNPHRRSDVSANWFAEACREVGLEVDRQDVIDWYGHPRLDCISMIRKP